MLEEGLDALLVGFEGSVILVKYGSHLLKQASKFLLGHFFGVSRTSLEHFDQFL